MTNWINIDIILAAPFIISLLLGFAIIGRMKLISYDKSFFLSSEERRNKGLGIEISGISVFPLLVASLCISVSLPFLFHLTALRKEVEPSTMRIMQILVASSILFIVGLKDDLHGTSSKIKFFALLATALMFPATNLWINNLDGLFGISEVPAYIGMPLTVLLVMYVTEMMDLFDDVNGLTCSFGAIMVAVFLAFSIYGHFTLSTLISAATMGVLTVYLIEKLSFKNWKNTTLGTAGAYVFGYVISYLAIGLSRQGDGRLPKGMILICFATIMIPMFDLLRVLRSRIRDSRSLSNPDRNQLQHKLIRTGLSNALIPFVLLGIMTMNVFVNTIGIYYHLNLTFLFCIDVLLWIAIELTINFFIHRNEKIHMLNEWNKAYGEDSWYANIPHETLKRKVENYGTLGLPPGMRVENDIEFIPDGMTGFGRATKRLLDFIVSGICLIIFSPLFLLSYILIKIDDGGPAIFSQERLGRFGRPFKIHKFRSMRMDAEKLGPALSHAGGDDDPRLTKVGKFLRVHHLDELPQLWNVFRGDMAFIGYRPERKFYIDQIMMEDPRYAFLYQIRPGVTSYATLYNGYTDTMEKMLRRLELDLYYLGHRSWWLDCKILMLTFLSIIFGKKF